MKVCTKCQKRKSLDEFSWKNKTKGKKAPECKSCHRLLRKKYYELNKEKEISRIMARKKNIRKKLYEYLIPRCCEECGEDDSVVLEFHHIKEKKHNISLMTNDGYSWDNILKEIEKCIILCANCHRRKTAKEFNWHNY